MPGGRSIKGIRLPPEIELFQRFFKILNNQGIWPPHRRRAGDQNVVMAGRRVNRQYSARGFAQPPAGPVSLDRAADPAAGRQPVSDRRTRMRMTACLQHKSRRHGFFSFCSNPKEFRPPLKRADGRRHGALSRQTFAAFFPAPGQYLTPGLRRHPGAEPVTPLAYKTARLVGTFHDTSPRP